MKSVTIGTASDPGQERDENQDYCAYHSPENGILHKKGILLALADGMGGHSGGAVASRIAIDVLMEEYYKDIDHNILDSLNKAFLKANEEVRVKGEQDEALSGMGTTLTAVVLKKDRMYYAHVGDSRGYIIYKNRIWQFTDDHSLVAGLVKAGYINEEEAATHPDRNIITRAIGIKSDLKVDLSRIDKKTENGQYILLCCDGLHGVVSNEEMLNTTYKHQEPETVCERLVEKANEQGGPDNITVLIARIEGSGFLSRFMNLMR